MQRHTCFVLSLALAHAPACLSSPDTSAPPTTPALSASDARGRVVPLDRLPRRPRLELRSASAAAPDPWLFEGPCDDPLRQDLERLPLTAASASRQVAVRLTREPGMIALEPRSTLRKGASYTLVWARACIAALQVDGSASAGAALHATFPAADAGDVPARTQTLALSFDGEVTGAETGIWLEDDAGYALDAELEAVSCSDYDTAAHSCRLLQLGSALEPGRSYTLRSGRDLRDAHGAAVDSVAAPFTTSDARSEPGWRASECALDERPIPGGCALLTDTALALRLFPRPDTRIAAELAGRRVTQLPEQTNLLRWDGLAPATPYPLQLHYSDLLDHTLAMHEPLQTAAALAPLSITEIRADPRGPERSQEYVELFNFGDHAEPLGGCFLADSASDPGTRLETSVVLAPGARALLVAEGFDTDSALDEPATPGTPLIRVGKTLTRAGLSNSGEALFLRDAAQRRLSASPALPANRGLCLARTTPDPRSGEPTGFSARPCSPGS